MTKSDIDYFAKRDHLSKSAIDLLLECPAKFRAWELGEDEEQDSAALRFGSLAHLLTLQPKEFATRYAVTDLNLSTKEGKAFKAAAESGGMEVIKGAEYEKAQMIADAVRTHPQAKMLFDSKEYVAEQPIYWEYNGVRCKCKPDAVAVAPNGLRYCLDLKTTQSANPEEIRRSIAKYHYYRQAAWYLAGLNSAGMPCDAFIFCFVEKSAPYLVTMCQLDEESLTQGMTECDSAIRTLKKCRETGIYPCYTREILTMSLPEYAKTKNVPNVPEDENDETEENYAYAQ